MQLVVGPRGIARYRYRRLERLGLEKVYNKENPFLWLSESTDLRKKKNFFETRLTEYQTGSLEWDEEEEK